MNVAALQSFVRNLAAVLRDADGSKVAGEFERVAAGLEPFRDYAVTQLVDFLAQAEEYHRTGQLPARGRGQGTRRTPTKTMDTAGALRSIQGLYENATRSELTVAAIESELNSVVRGLSKDELAQVARDFDLAVEKRATKKAIGDQIRQKILDRKGIHQRVQVIGEPLPANEPAPPREPVPAS